MGELLWHVNYTLIRLLKKKNPNTSIGSFSKKQIGNEFRPDLLVSVFLCEKRRGTHSPPVGTRRGRIRTALPLSSVLMLFETMHVISTDNICAGILSSPDLLFNCLQLCSGHFYLCDPLLAPSSNIEFLLHLQFSYLNI